MNTYLLIAIAALAAALVTFLITFFILRAHEVKACNKLENQLISSQEALKAAQAIRQAESSAHEKALQLQQEGFDKQLEAVRNQLSAETEKLLKQREEALQKKAEETFKTLAGPLGKDLKAMQESFEGQKRSQAEGTASPETDTAEFLLTCKIADEQGKATDQVFRLLAGLNAPIRMMTEEKDTLEDIFLRNT